MKLFDQVDFSGGLNAEFDRLKTPRNSYPLLLNGRIRNGNIQPVKKHVKDTNIPAGNYQDLVTVGDYLVVLVSGEVLYRNINSAGPWQRIPGWTLLDSAAAEIFCTLIPVSTNFFNTSGSPTSPNLAYNAQIAQTAQGLLISDGINQPRILYADLSWEVLNTYAQWNQNNPEYVPVCRQSVVSGVKLFAVSADKKKIYQSVSGRYTDFVINITASGGKGGDADTTSYAVDFNDLTAIHPTQQGGLLASTLFATYLLVPSDQTIFNEVILSVGDPAFPVGAVNWKSYVPILGDVAFIAQGGIHSINVTAQLQRESNNNPFSRTISRYLVNPQTDTCAASFDDYALFAVNTTVGRGVFVYDTLREQFVSLDTGFGVVKKFASYKTAAGTNRLFFINADNELYEAYADSANQVCRVLLGDYAYFEEGVRYQMKVDNLYLWFNNITATDIIRVDVFADGRLLDSAEVSPAINNLTNLPPAAIPFIDQEDILPLKYGLPPREAAKLSVQLSWSSAAELVGISGDGAKEPIIQTAAKTLKSTTVRPYIVLANPDIHTAAVSTGSMQQVSGLVVGLYYYVAGTADIGSRTVRNAVFRADLATIRLNGSLYNVTDFRDIWLTAKLEPNRHETILTLGNLTDGTETGWQRISTVLPIANVQGAASAKDLDQPAPSWYERRERYYMVRGEQVEFFVLSGGWNSANLSLDPSGNPTGSSTEIDGFSATSTQAQWLRYWLGRSTRRFKVVLIGYPPYTDQSSLYPGFAPLRWPFAAWGADLALSMSPGVYERFYINGFPYINLGTGGTAGAFASTAARSIRRSAEAGYISLLPRTFSLDLEFKSANGQTIDATTIYSR